MMKRFFLTAALCLAQALSGLQTMQAEETVPVLAVYQKDGTRIVFRLKETPKATVENGQLRVAATSLSSSFDMNMLSRFTFETDIFPDGIDAPAADSEEARLLQEGEWLHISPLPENASVAIYDMQGQSVRTEVQRREGGAAVPLEGLTPSAYVLQVGEKSYKFIRQ